MLKECKTEEYPNELQQIQWKEQGKEEDRVKDGGTKLKRISVMGIINRRTMARNSVEWRKTVNLMWVWPCIVVKTWKWKGQLDATDGSLLQNLLLFRTPLCPSSGAQEYYTGGCCLWCLVLWFTGCWSGVELWVMCPVCGMLQHPANWTCTI